jgi:hypothetical protein
MLGGVGEKMKTYFVSCLSSRVLDLLAALAKHDVAPGQSDSEHGFLIIQIECSEDQANGIWAEGFNVAEK